MCKLQCLFALFALYVGHVNSWDIAITTANQIEFYTNKHIINNRDVKSSGLTALAYDAVYNMLLFVDKQSDNASIFSYHLNTKTSRPLVRKNVLDDIQGLAFDPISVKLFWTDKNEKGIYWKSLKPGSKDDVNVLLKLDNELPRAIAVDSCRGYVYWTNVNFTKPTIERVKIDGTGREVIVNSDIYLPVGLAIDQRTRKLYWADDKEGVHYSIESSDLDGKDKQTVVKGILHQPNALTVSNDSLYWIDWDYKSVWKLPKGARHSNNKIEPEQLITFAETPYSIVANYSIADQTEGIEECSALKSLSLNVTAIESSINIPNEGIYCLHGIKVDKSECKCNRGYTGQRCEISLCQNYCFEGECTITADGQPQCSCKNGFSGVRCEINQCYGYCLNEGRCVAENYGPRCSCRQGYRGKRCEDRITVPAPTFVTRSAEDCNCTKLKNSSDMSSDNLLTTGDFVETCNTGWDPVRDPAIMVLGILSGLLCLVISVLITKVWQLKKRPRIKKRFIVQKNSTPLTARPDQCEITIENCCNMNICETPCFEPRSTIRPTLLDSKPGKEDKMNLISNMEFPDDY